MTEQADRFRDTNRRGSAEFSLTDEQQQAVELFGTQQSLRVNAFAGSGKSSTLLAMAQSDSRSGLYLAFNRSIADEAKKKFPATVDCRTTHSLAFRTVLEYYKSTPKLTDSLNANAIAELLALEPVTFRNLKLSSTSFGSLVKRTLACYCQSADRHVLPSHVPHSGKIALLDNHEWEQLSQCILHYVQALWSKMIDSADPTPLGHDGYLKLWASSSPRIQRDYILVDEAQDTSHVILDVFRRQTAQLVYVGDAHQQIYEWRGAVNAMERIETDHQSHLTMSFRFGEAIAEAANRILQVLEEPLPLRGNPARQSELGTVEFDALLSRTNGALVTELVNLLAQSKRVHVVGGVADILRLLHGVIDLQNNTPTDVPEFFGFTNWNEVLTAVKDDELPEMTTLVNLVERYAVPTLIAAVTSTESTADTANVEVATVHKAKGREWPRVRLTDDFLLAKDNKSDGQQKLVPREEVRIAYVAVTRAKEAVYIPPGLRTAFSISQDPRFDAFHQGQTALPADTPRGE